MSEPAPLIFIVDDDRGMLRLVDKTLQREGWGTAVADSAPAAAVACLAMTHVGS